MREYFKVGLSDLVNGNISDHLMITGDITNISLNDEFAYARKLINEYYLSKMSNDTEKEAWRYLSAIPGNHDTYTPTSVEKDLFGNHFGDTLGYQQSNTPTTLNDRFPAVKTLVTSCGTTSVIILSLLSGVPTKPFVAAGYIGKQQLDRASVMISQAREHNPKAYSVVLMHHPPIARYAEEWSEKMHGLPKEEKEAINDFCTKENIDLLLHGHTHQPFNGTPLSSNHTTVIDNGSSTYTLPEKNPVGRHHIYTIEGNEMIDCYARVWNTKQGIYEKQPVTKSESAIKKTKVR